MVNAVSMDNVEHAYAVQQLRKSGKNAKIVSLTLKIFTKLEYVYEIISAPWRYWAGFYDVHLPFDEIVCGTLLTTWCVFQF